MNPTLKRPPHLITEFKRLKSIADHHLKRAHEAALTAITIQHGHPHNHGCHRDNKSLAEKLTRSALGYHNEYKRALGKLTRFSNTTFGCSTYAVARFIP